METSKSGILGKLSVKFLKVFGRKVWIKLEIPNLFPNFARNYPIWDIRKVSHLPHLNGHFYNYLPGDLSGAFARSSRWWTRTPPRSWSSTSSYPCSLWCSWQPPSCNVKQTNVALVYQGLICTLHCPWVPWNSPLGYLVKLLDLFFSAFL